MEGKTIFHLKTVIPWFKEFPFEETEEWGRALRDNIPKRQKAILKAVPDDEAFRKKIANKALAGVDKMLRDDFVSQKGLTKETILRIMRHKLYGKKSARTYRRNIKRALKTFDQGELNSAMVGYHRGQCFGEYRFREAIELTLGSLTSLLIIQPGKEAGFIPKLSNQLMSSGLLISDLAYDPAYFKPENDKINRLINSYLKKEIVPFAAGGESHCDFVPIPASVRPDDSKEVRKIKYEIYKRFLSQTQADKVRAAWIVIDESTRPDPNEYIGHPEKPAYFDMELDVQVSKKDGYAAD